MEGTITGPILLSIILISFYGFAPTRMLIEQLFQGAAYGAAQGWKSSIAPTLSHIPGIGPLIDSTTNEKPPPGSPPATEPPVCITQWTFLKWSPAFGWNRAWYDDVQAAIAAWDTFNALDLVGNLVSKETCTDSDGNVTKSYAVIKYAPGHSDIDNPGNKFFNIP